MSFSFNPWRVTAIGLTAALIMMLFYLRICEINLKDTEMRAEHPMVEARTKIVKVQGPVRIVTRIIEKQGEKQIIIEEVRAPVTESNEGWSLNKPLGLEDKKLSKRWFMGLGMLGLEPGSRAFMAYGGLTLFDHLDLGVGLTTEKDPLVLGSWRF